MTRTGRILGRFGFYIPTKKLLATTTLLAFLFNLSLPFLNSYILNLNSIVIGGYTSISDSSSKDYLFQAQNEDLSAFFGDKEYTNSHRFAVLKNSAKFDLRLTEGEARCPLNSQGCTNSHDSSSILHTPVIDYASLEGDQKTANLARNLREQLEDLNQQSAQPQDGTSDGIIRTARLIKSVGSSDDRVEFIRSEDNRDIQINYEVISKGIKQSIFLNKHSLPTYQFLLNVEGLRVIKTGQSSYLLIDTEQTVAIQIGKPTILGSQSSVDSRQTKTGLNTDSEAVLKSDVSINIHQEPRGIIMELGIDPAVLASQGQALQGSPIIIETNFLISTDQTLLSKINEVTQGILDNPTKTLSVRGSNHPDYLYEHINNKFQVGFGSKLKGKTQLAYSAGGQGGIEMALLGEGKNVTVRQNTRLEKDETLNKEASIMEGGSPFVLAATSPVTLSEAKGIYSSASPQNDNTAHTLVDSIQAVDARPNVDIEYKVFPQGVKENIILKYPVYSSQSSVDSSQTKTGLNTDSEAVLKSEHSFKYALKTSGVKPIKDKEGLWGFYSLDTDSEAVLKSDISPLFSIPKPYAIDNSGTITTDVTLDIVKGSECIKSFKQFSVEGNGCYTITIEVDPEWLNDPNRSYPIVIDPSIVDDTTAEFAITNDSAISSAFNRTKDTGSGSSPVLETFYQETYKDINTGGLWHANENSANTCTGGANDVCNAGTVGSSVDMAFNGNTAFTTSSRLGASAVDLDGTGDYLSAPDNASFELSNRDFTIAFWLYLDAYPANGLGAALFAKDSGGANFSPLSLVLRNNANHDIHAWMTSNGTSWNLANDEGFSGSGARLSLSTWLHISFVRSNTLCSLYINGAFVDSTNSSCSGTLQDNALTHYIGGEFQSTAGSGGINGRFDEYRIDHVARSQDEIKLMAQRRPSATFTSTIFDFTGSMAAFQSLTWTENGVATGDGETLYSSTSLVAQWNFNETSGTTAAKAAGSCATTTCDLALGSFASTASQDQAAGTGWTANNRRWGAGAVMTDGANDTLSCTDANCGGTSKLDYPGSGGWSISTWIKPNSVVDTSYYLGKASAYWISQGSTVVGCSTGKIGYSFWDGSAWKCAQSTTVTVPGTWYFVTGTYDRTTLKIYINGVLEGSTAATAAIADSASDFCISGCPAGLGVWMNTVVDSTAIYARALTQNEIISNYNHSNIEFQTRSGTTATPNDGTWEAWKPTTNETAISGMDGPYQYSASEANLQAYWAMDELVQNSCSGGVNDACDVSSNSNDAATSGSHIVDGKFGKGRYFDGSAIHLSVADNATLDFAAADNFTVEAWVRHSGTAANTYEILSKYDTTNGGYRLYMHSTTGGYCFAVDDDATMTPDDEVCSTVSLRTDGGWHHIVGTKTGTTNIKIYVDGVNTTTKTSLVATGTLANTNTFYIGTARDGSTNPWNGEIDEVRVYNTALSDATIKEKFIEGALQTTGSNISNSTDTSLKVEGTASQKTVLGAPKVDSHTVGLWRMDETDSGPFYDSTGHRSFATDNTGNLESNIQSFWKMDDSGGTAVDSISQNDATSITGTSVVAGKLSNAKDFDGVDDILVHGSPTSLDDLQAMTISAWIFPDTIGENSAGFIINKNVGASQNAGWILLLQGTNTVQFVVDGSTDLVRTSSNSVITLNAWNHVVLTWDGVITTASSVHIYVNGTEVSYATTTNGAGRVSDASSSLYIGNSSTQDRTFDGKIDEVGLWKRVLPLSEIGDLYNGSNANSLSSKASRNGTILSAPTVVDGVFGKARNFDGSDDFIDIGTPINASTGSIELWMKPDITTADNSPIRDLGGYSYFRFQPTDKFEFGIFDGAGKFTPQATVTVGKWYHVVGTWDSSNIRLYVDGILIGTTAAGAIQNVTNAVRIGGSTAASTTDFDGMIDEVKISNVARTADDIWESYRAGRDHRMGKAITSTDLSSKSSIPFYIAADRPGTYLEATVGESAYANYEPDANTVGLWPLEERRASTNAGIKDYSGYGNHATTATGVTFVQGKIGKARDFDGTDDTIDVGASTNFDFGTTSDFSLEAWIKTSTAAADTVIGKFNSACNLGYDMRVNIVANKLTLRVHDGASSDVTSNTSVNDGNWHHVVATRSSSGTVQKIYIDGALDNSATVTARSATVTGNMAIGSTGSCAGQYFSGIIDEARVSNSARSADEIRQAFEVSKRTHPITIDFASNPQAAYSSGTSITVNNSSGQTNLSDSLKPGDTLIVQENVGGTEYRGTATVSKVANTSSVYGTVTLAAAISSIPPGGYTTAAKAFKWQREYFPLQGITLRGTHDNAVTRLTIRVTDGSQGANIWLDDFKSNSNYLTTSSGSTPTSTAQRYFQYRGIFTNADPAVSANLTAVTQNYRIGPRMDQIMRHGFWFNSQGQPQPFWWAQ